MIFALYFTSISKDDGRRIPSHISIDEPTRLEQPLFGYGAQLTVSGPEDVSISIKGAHTLQVLEVALFVTRTVLAGNASQWIYEDMAGEPLDFSYTTPGTR